jgi:hypothetical protein
MPRYAKYTLFLLAAAGLFQSCDKTKETIANPVLAVTATQNTSGPAGKKMDFDIDAADADNISRVKIDLQAGSGPVTVFKDSTIDPAKPHVVFSVQFTLPETGLKGDAFNFTFTAFDTKGNSSSTTKTLTISGSRPKIEIGGPDNVTADQTVNFNVTFSDPGADLKNFNWSESVKGGAQNSLKDSTFADGVKNAIVPFTYHIPADFVSGDYVVMLFTAMNKDNVSWTVTKRFTVQ